MPRSRTDHVQSLKEVVRHALYSVGGPNLVRSSKKIRGLRSDHISGEDLGKRFSTIYDENIWGAGGGSRSGPGSNPEVVGNLTQGLLGLLTNLNASQVTDIGCGDFGWMDAVCGCFSYTGVDIVKSLIADHSQKYGSPNRCFKHLDATKDKLPGGDVAICREVLFHLSFQDVSRVLANCKKSGYRYLLATSDSAIWFNADICSGDHRPLNLQKAPFNFPEPVHRLADDSFVSGRMLGAWLVEDINLI